MALKMAIHLPLKYQRTAGGYQVTDAADRIVAYIYARDDPATARAAHVLTWPEAEEHAKAFVSAAAGAAVPVSLMIWGHLHEPQTSGQWQRPQSETESIHRPVLRTSL